MIGRNLKAVVFVLTITSLFWQQTAVADPVTYVVEPGDALSTLANRFDVTINQIREWNDLDGDLIRIGQELVIHPGAAQYASSGWLEYTIARGDTISAIAGRYDVSVADVVGWNDGLDPDRIREGQEIRIQGSGRAQRQITYEVGSGDFVARIARRFGVTVEQIVGWNSGLDPDRVRIGQELVLYIEGPEAESESVGRASGGRLVNGEQLPSHRGYVIRDDDLAWGTNETISFMLDGFDAVRGRHSDSPRLEIHDLSREEGGSLRGHRSHQSGRDADIALYRTGCGEVCDFRSTDPESLDVELEWALIRHWIRNDQVEYIFLDYELQEPLYEYVRDVRGATESQLDEWFQYPHGRRTARGIVRHEPNHDDHIHVRFSCSGSDDACQ